MLRLFFVISFIAAPFHTHAQALSEFDYLSSATNRVHQAWELGPDLSLEEFQGATTAACQALTRLADEVPLEAELFQDDRRAADLNEVFGTVESLGQFLQLEIELLTSLGISDAAAKDLTSLSLAFEAQTREAGYEPELILGRVQIARDAVCRASEEARTVANAQGRWVVMGRIFLGVGGTAIVIVNALATTPSAGVAAASMTLGGALAGSAF